MRKAAWFLVGWLFAFQATQLFPSQKGFSYILSSFILEPLSFLEGSVFILASFIIFSYSIRYTIYSLIRLPDEMRRRRMVYGIIGSITVIIAWGVLVYESIFISLAVIFLTLIHLGLSFEKRERETYKER